MIKNLDHHSFKNEIINYDLGEHAPYEIRRNTVIEFYLTECPHCKAMWPIVNKATEEFPDIDFFKIEASEYPELAALYNIQGTPAFIFIPMKGKPKMAMGEMPFDEFVKLIKNSFQ
ncbi:MAG: thioredoxin family protein [Bacteroidales bacterium]